MKHLLLILGFMVLAFTTTQSRRRFSTGTGRNRRMQAPLSYQHTWDRSDRWFNNRWWDQLEYPIGLNTNPMINQYSPINCPHCQ